MKKKKTSTNIKKDKIKLLFSRLSTREIYLVTVSLLTSVSWLMLGFCDSVVFAAAAATRSFDDEAFNIADETLTLVAGVLFFDLFSLMKTLSSSSLDALLLFSSGAFSASAAITFDAAGGGGAFGTSKSTTSLLNSPVVFCYVEINQRMKEPN